MLPRTHPALRPPKPAAIPTPVPSPEPPQAAKPDNFFTKVEKELIDIWNSVPDSPFLPTLLFYPARDLVHESDFYNTLNFRDKFVLTDGFKVVGYINRDKVYDMSMFY